MVVGVFGPTASGKTDVAEKIADQLGGELVSADAMQAYRGLPILTNQSERPTRLVGVWPLDHEASVGEYQELAHRADPEHQPLHRNSAAIARAAAAGSAASRIGRPTTTMSAPAARASAGPRTRF